MDLTKLKNELAEQKSASKEEFERLVVVYTGGEKKSYFPPLRDNEGNKITDDKGKVKRSEKSNGWQYEFALLGNRTKVVKVIVDANYNNIELLNVFVVSGLGYDMKQQNMIFIDEKGAIKKYV